MHPDRWYAAWLEPRLVIGGFYACCFTDFICSADHLFIVRAPQTRGVPMIWGLLILLGLFLVCLGFIAAAERL